jgi:WD40 repeat protein
MLAAVAEDRSVWLWETGGARGCRRLGERPSFVYDLAVSGDGSRLATTDFAGGVTVWDVACGQTWDCGKGAVAALSLSPDGSTLAFGVMEEGAIWLGDASTGEQRGRLSGHAAPVMALAFSRDGRTLASRDMHGVVKLWDLAEGKERATLTAAADHAVNNAAAVTFAPDGRTLAVAVDRAVQLCDVATGRLAARLEGHEGRVKCLAFSPDSKLLASGSFDKTVRLWVVPHNPTSRPESPQSP